MDGLRPLFVVIALATLVGAAIIVASDNGGESNWTMIGTAGLFSAAALSICSVAPANIYHVQTIAARAQRNHTV